jgi:trimeric autotransporter adhesin
MNQAVSFGLLGAGGILLTKALTGSSFAEVVKGHPGAVADTGSTLTVAGAGTAITSAASTAAAATVPGTGAAAIGQVKWSTLRALAAQYGWSASEITDWISVIGAESGGDPSSLNKSSGAYGIGQFLGKTKTEYAPYGATSADPVAQLTAMAKYIHDRYGTPANAWAHEQSAHWY